MRRNDKVLKMNLFMILEVCVNKLICTEDPFEHDKDHYESVGAPANAAVPVLEEQESVGKKFVAKIFHEKNKSSCQYDE